MMNPVEPESEKISFPKNEFSELAHDVLSEILAHENMREYVRSHEGLSENIQTDILEWLKKTNTALGTESPFTEEAAFIAQQKKLSAQEIASDVSADKSKIQQQYKLLPSVNTAQHGSIAESDLDFDFYKKQFCAHKIIKKTDEEEKIGWKIGWKSEEKLETLRRNFIADMERNLLDRKNKWEQERIDAARRQFLEELYKKIDQFQRLEKLVSPFIADLGYLWDLSSRPFKTSGFEILDSFAKLLEQDESLQELAALLGKQSRAQSVFEKELRDKVVVKTEFHPKPAYRGQVMGVTYSNDISSVLPSELALLKNPKTKKLFMLKFAQKQLLSFKYENDEAVEKQETEREELSAEKKEPKGPIVICVDTSGSMHGTPEHIAKTVTFALAKIAIEEERKCYLISFSTGIETLDMSDFKTGNALERLVQFLRMSFHGGTDAAPALNHALKLLNGNSWKNADVLLISDFVMGSLPDEVANAIEAEKEKNTEFHSLVIGSSGNKAAVQNFNHNWLYDMNDAHAARHLAEQLHELRK
ncbi:MAG: VWA domain-containing protein, partial [Treponemataceae bacterium]|nr:VWA domain-containing protein [Treponemataceae bacterium]